jgi:PAS domain S-box-containing protein
MRTGATKIATLYTLAGILWITLSDRILLAMQKHFDLNFVLFLSSIKGICYVLITGVMLYQLIRLYTKRLAESEEQYRSYFEEHPTPHWIINRRTMLFVAANNSAVSHYGYSREEFLKMSALDIRPKEDIKESIMVFRELKTGFNAIGIKRHLKKDGTIINVNVTAQVLSARHTENVMISASIIPD